MQATPEPAATRPLLDEESREWLRSLRASGHARDEALVRLHALLLRAAGFEVARPACGEEHESLLTLVAHERSR